jgi:hypothetical protein
VMISSQHNFSFFWCSFSFSFLWETNPLTHVTAPHVRKLVDFRGGTFFHPSPEN